MDALILASTWPGALGSTALMLLGFGLVILTHELGHFLVAKWVDIRVDEFAIGFGKKLWSIKRGETEYRINMLPLGGYVKMPGQEDFALKEGEETDPRAFNNKPIWARMCVVSAGVVMNVILAAILFFAVFRIGKDYTPTLVGEVRPGYPADQVKLPGDLGTGLRSGDLIERIDGRDVWKFSTLYTKAILADPSQTFKFQIRRPGVGEPFEVNLGVAPAVSLGRRIRAFGITPAIDRVLPDGPDAAEILGQISGGKLTGGDTIVSVAGQLIDQGWRIGTVPLTAEPVAIEVERTDPATGGTTRHTASVTPELTWSDALIRRVNLRALNEDKKPPFDPPTFNVLGLRPRIRIRIVVPDTSASKAGIRAGDVVASYGPAGDVPTVERLREISKNNRGAAVPIRILRDGQIDAAATGVDVPDKEQPTIGIDPCLDHMHLVVAAVMPDTPLADEIPVGAIIRAFNGNPVTTWQDLIDGAAALADGQQTITLTYETPAGAEHQTSPIALAEFGFDSADYTWRLPLALFQELAEPKQESNPLAAIKLGVQETGDFILMTYATLHGFFAGRVSGSNFSGPIGIFRAGIAVGERGPIWVVWLLAIISANLAVINFLPLPIVDGGLAVMLIIEKIRRKPLSVTVQNAIQVVGLVLIAVLFVLLTYNDIYQWMRNG